jgi:Cdc6-like AAA superfamily ATPase
MLVVNLYGGPGTGKSTTAAEVYSMLKKAGLNAELVTEYAKEKVWDKHFNMLDNQLYITAKQYHRQFRLLNQLDVIVTDSPLLLSLYYNKRSKTPTSEPDVIEHFEGMVIGLFNSFNNMNIFLKRQKEYNPKGRMQTEEEAKQIDIEISKLLIHHGMPFENILCDDSVAMNITRKVLEKLSMKLPVPQNSDFIKLDQPKFPSSPFHWSAINWR